MITAQEARELIPQPFISDEELFNNIKSLSTIGNDFTYQSLTDEQVSLFSNLGYTLDLQTPNKKPNYYRISW